MAKRLSESCETNLSLYSIVQMMETKFAELHSLFLQIFGEKDIQDLSQKFELPKFKVANF